MSNTMNISIEEFEKLQIAMQEYQGNTEKAINDVLHNQAGGIIQDSVKNLIPVSGRTWNGKRKGAKAAKSLKSVNSNLTVKVTTTSNYQYLYFPDDGSSTVRHAGEQHFFRRGGDLVTDEIIDLCVGRLISDFEKE